MSLTLTECASLGIFLLLGMIAGIVLMRLRGSGQIALPADFAARERAALPPMDEPHTRVFGSTIKPRSAEMRHSWITMGDPGRVEFADDPHYAVQAFDNRSGDHAEVEYYIA